MRVADLQQPMVQMHLVGAEGAAPGAGAAHDRQQHVQRRHEHHRDHQQEGRQQREDVASAVCALRDRAGRGRRRGRQHQADQHGTGVPHEDARRVEVVRQESQARPGEHHRYHRRGVEENVSAVVAQQADGEEADRHGGDEPESGREPVESVDEVHRVDHGDRQRQREQNRGGLVEHDGAHPAEGDVEHAPGDAHGDQDAGRGDLAGELGQRVQAPSVVDQADPHDESPGDHHRRYPRGVDESAIEGRQLGGQEHRADHPEIHGQAPHPGGRQQVDVTFARVGHRPEPPREHPHPAGGEVGDDGGGQADKGQFAQRDAGAPVGQRQHGVCCADHRFRRYRSISGQRSRLDAEDLGYGGGAHRALAQDLRLGAAEVEDGRGGLLLGGPAVEVHIDEVT